MQIILPKELTEKSPVKAGLGIISALIMFFGSAYAVYTLFGTSLGLGLKALFAPPLLIIGGYGMLLLGFMGHDGTHFTLSENRITSSILGILLTAPVFPYMVMGFTISHWNHHRFTNTEKDPDSLLFSKFKNIFTRALLARPYAFMEYGLNTIRLALGKPLPFEYQFPLSKNTVRRLAQFNLLATLFFGYVLIRISSSNYKALVVLLALYLFGTVISGLSPYIEHTGTGIGRGIDTRTADGWSWDFFLLGNNYHLEHHLFPTIPFYNLKKAHLHLKQSGFYTQEKFFSHGPVETYRYALSKYVYPNQRA